MGWARWAVTFERLSCLISWKLSKATRSPLSAAANFPSATTRQTDAGPVTHRPREEAPGRASSGTGADATSHATLPLARS